MYIYRIHEIKLRPGESKDKIPDKIKSKIGKKNIIINQCKIVRESIDARDKKDIYLVYTVDFHSSRELNMERPDKKKYKLPSRGKKEVQNPPVVLGFGPCGMFAALILAERGYRPIVLERGSAMEKRIADVEAFWDKGLLNEESNVQFGEGGAGTFSDGKLTTGLKDIRLQKVLEELVEAGADPEILYKKKPHIGTDKLRSVVVNIREKIIKLGGKVRFDSKVTDLFIKEGRLCAVSVGGREMIATGHLVLAPGHSARDTFKMAKDKKAHMEQKPFSMGLRIRHPQRLINKAQYGDPKLADVLGPAEYKLNYKARDGRGVYTFCMCPGGEIIVCSSEKGGVAVNGMSCSKRDGLWANSAVLVDVRPEDFGSDDPLAGLEFQRYYERIAFKMGGEKYKAPVSTLEEFCLNKGNGRSVRLCVPVFAAEDIREALPYFGRKISGFNDSQVQVAAVESRSSSPVRILRDKDGESNIKGIFPAGEGAGYAGGIMSAAADGIKAAEKIISRCTISREL